MRDRKKKSSFLSREILRNREIVVFKSENKKICNTRNKKDMYWFYVNDPMTENELRNFNERGKLRLSAIIDNIINENYT